VYGELDPKDPHKTIINDIDLAPANAAGKVEYMATFFLVKPIDMSQSKPPDVAGGAERRRPDPRSVRTWAGTSRRRVFTKVRCVITRVAGSRSPRRSRSG